MGIAVNAAARLLFSKSANQRSTRLSHEPPVGVKMQMEARVPQQPARNGRPLLVRSVVVRNQAQGAIHWARLGKWLRNCETRSLGTPMEVAHNDVSFGIERSERLIVP